MIAIHAGLLLVNTATIILMFILAKRLFGALAGIVAAASFALLSVGFPVLGFAGHATHFVLLPAIAGLVLLLKAIDARRISLLFLSGLMLGMAFLMKQPGIFFGFFAFGMLAYQLRKRNVNGRNLFLLAGIFLVGAAIPFALTCLFFLGVGGFDTFWFWTFRYASVYGSHVGLSEGMMILKPALLNIIIPSWPIWLWAGIGVMALMWDSTLRGHRLFTSGFFVFSFAAVFPGLYFRAHYFVLLLPALSLLCAIAVSCLTRLLAAHHCWKAIPGVLFACTIAFTLWTQKEYFFESDPLFLSRQIYWANPFMEAPTIANYLEKHSDGRDRIAILGSEPEIFFYAHRLSATGYIYMYPLVENQPLASQMQREMIADITAARPKFLVLVNIGMSWMVQRGFDETLLQWSNIYIHDHYRKAGIVDMFVGGSEYHWDDAETYLPRSPYTVAVYERLQ